jgi:ATP-binding cassette subfamily F protein 3
VLVVSHDRRFLDRVATRVFHLDDGVVTLYPGTYSEFVARNRRPKVEPVVVAAPAAAPAGKESHEKRRKRSREEERKKKRVADVERMIAESETTLTTLRAELTEGYGNDWAKLAKRAEEERVLAAKVDTWTEEWMKLSEEFA